VTTHTIRVWARDYTGNESTREVTGLKVSYAEAEMSEPPVTSSPTLSPKPDGSAEITIAYNLNQDVNSAIYMVSIGGEMVWTRHFSAGEMGGQAGYNTVSFNGISDISGLPLGNGIYVYKIVAEGRVIGKGHIVIYD